jgi:hypothetical protein
MGAMRRSASVVDPSILLVSDRSRARQVFIYGASCQAASSEQTHVNIKKGKSSVDARRALDIYIKSVCNFRHDRNYSQDGENPGSACAAYPDVHGAARCRIRAVGFAAAPGSWGAAGTLEWARFGGAGEFHFGGGAGVARVIASPHRAEPNDGSGYLAEVHEWRQRSLPRVHCWWSD